MLVLEELKVKIGQIFYKECILDGLILKIIAKLVYYRKQEVKMTS